MKQLSVLSFLAGSEPIDAAGDILLPFEIQSFDEKGIPNGVITTEDIMTNRTAKTLAHFIALELDQLSDADVIPTLEKAGFGIPSLHDVLDAIPQNLRLYDIVSNYLNDLIRQDLCYEYFESETSSAFKQIYVLNEEPQAFSSLAIKLAAIHYYQVKNHDRWQAASRQFMRRLERALSIKPIAASA